MLHGTAEGTRVASSNGFVRRTDHLTPEEISSNWQCKKRDGTTVPFDCGKIRKALYRCFHNIQKDMDLDEPYSDTIVNATVDSLIRGVVNTVEAQHLTCPDVEQVQRFVIQQLWARGMFAAAEHYQNYREAHRKARLTRPVPVEVASRVLEDQRHFPSDLQYYQFMSKFAKWREDLKRRETWKETTYERVMPWFQAIPQAQGKLSSGEWQELSDAMFNMEVSPAMRVVQMAGPALDRCNVGAYNCAYSPLDDVFAFPELLYILMQGTGQGFSCESEYVNELPRIRKQRGIKPDVLTVEDSTEGWCHTYYELLQRLWDGHDAEVDPSNIRKKGTRLKTKGGRACLTGDTVVYKDKKKATGENTLTVAQLYEKRLKTPRRLRHIKLRCLDEATGTFQRNRVVDVIDNGVADVFEVVTASGYKIRATANHRFMSGDRVYQHLDQFTTGDLIAVNGAEVKTGKCVDCDNPVSRRAERCRLCADEAQICPDANETTARQRKRCRAANIGVCSVCGRDDLSTQVHHKDRNPLNNEPGNLLCVCEPCHRVLHAAEDTFGNPYSHKYLSFDRIVSIVPAGRERVYDLCMEAPNHNFVANGFVSHNSGPEPYMELVNFTRNLVKSRQGRYLEDIDAHDLACMTGKIVQVGGVRRAAEISLSDLDSEAMRNAKSGNWYDRAVHRTMANNSAVYDFDENVPVEVFMTEWLSLTKSKSGERGIFNRNAAIKHSPKRRQWGRHRPGCNPCAEILLRPHQFCNLSIVIARAWDTVKSLVRKVRLAAIFGKLQSLCTNFRYIRPEWKKNCEEERLLGVDITGHADCPLLRHDAPGRSALLQMLNGVVEQVDIEFSQRFGVNRSAANTTVKPGGDSSVFFDCASGLSARFSAYQMRWVRESNDSPVAKFLSDSGVPHAPAPEAPNSLMVFGFPKKAPEGATCRNDMTARQQFFNWLDWKQNWAEHSVSATIYVEDKEWPELGGLVYNHIDHITGLSFLPKDNGIYSYAPNEELTEDKYNEVMAKFPDLNWAKLTEYETEDMTESAQTFACVGGGCG